MTDIKKQLGGELFNNIPLINYAFLKNQQKGELLKEEDGVMCSQIVFECSMYILKEV